MSSNVRDKRQKRIATVVALLFGAILHSAMCFGLFGEVMSRFSIAYLVAILLVLGGRAVLTEVGVRRKPLEWERRLDDRFRVLKKPPRDHA